MPKKNTAITKTISFIRHGESQANAGGISQQQHTIALTEKGHQQARDVVNFLPTQPAKVFTSAFLRTQETAVPYCAISGVSPTVDAQLNEFHILSHELIAGMDGQSRKVMANDYWCAADLEKRMGAMADTFYEFACRVSTWINTLDDFADNTVIFGHGMWLGMLKWQLAGNTVHSSADMAAYYAFQKELALENCAVSKIVQSGPKGWCVIVQAQLNTMKKEKQHGLR